MIKAISGFFTKLFSLPEFCVARISPINGKVEYLYGINEDVWVNDINDALLFVDIEDVKTAVSQYDEKLHVVLSWLDAWPTHKVFEELMM